MSDWTRRLAMAGLLAFLTFFFALPVSCCGFVLLNEHRFGDVQGNGPAAILSAMAVSAVLSGLVAVFAWRKARPRF